MKKAVRLRVTLYVRGEDEPAHDFARSAARAVREIISAGREAHPELRVSVRRIVEDDAGDADDEEEGNDENESDAPDGRHPSDGDGAAGASDGR